MDIQHWVHQFTAFVSLHPHWAGAIAFLTAMAEAIALVGLLVPGTSILIGIGALVGLGHLALWPILIWAALGAIAGDGLSYWLGRRYHETLRSLWPFSRHPEWLRQGEAYFREKGAMSVVLGRFFPVLRSVVPAVAGMLNMPPARFYAVNILSALLWSPAHILPGALAGAALARLGDISARLVALLFALLLLTVLLDWLLRVAFAFSRRLYGWAGGPLERWAEGRQGSWASLARWLTAPDRAASRLAAVGALALTALLALVAWLSPAVLQQQTLAMNQALSHAAGLLRTPWTDALMLAFSALGDAPVALGVAAVAILWLLLHRQVRVSGYFLAGLGLAWLFVSLFKSGLALGRPHGAGLDAYPSGHATFAASLYGMTGSLLLQSLGWRRARFGLAPLMLLVGLIALARIYLQVHWPSDVLAGLAFGLAMSLALGLLVAPLPPLTIHPRAFAVTVLATLLLLGSWHVPATLGTRLNALKARHAHETELGTPWRAAGWHQLPLYRIDLVGAREEPILLQWRGDAASLETALERQGWQQPPSWDSFRPAALLRVAGDVLALPVMPMLNDGRAPRLTLIRRAAVRGKEGRLVLYAWTSGYVSAGKPIFVAGMRFERAHHPFSSTTLLLPDDKLSCSGDPLLLALPRARAVGPPLPGKEGMCGGRLVLAE